MAGANFTSDLINDSSSNTEEVILKKDCCSDCEIAMESKEACEKFICNCQNEPNIADSEDLDLDDSATTASLALPKRQKDVLRLGKGKNPKLRTSKDVYDRLKWDSESITIQSSNNELDQVEKLDTSSIYIGYKDRFLGMCELPLEEYNPGGDIPFHRIYYFRTGGPPVLPFIGKDGEVKVREDNLPEGTVFIWDRESRTDLVFKSGNSTIFK